ncbi:ATP-binding protein [Nocardiopsis sediminis]|uniref:ATP-binding protein n=1 Tax=Nocardiopsis sediminis TaxID=1778267 RepID=A0ABV8FTY6_9ACTN
MTRVPETPAPALAPVRWEPRAYPGDLAQSARVRADLIADLDGFGLDLIDDVTLCAAELFANAARHTASGEPGGDVLRFLGLPTPDTLRLTVVDSGGGRSSPAIPFQRSAGEWATAEGQRGLLLVDALSTAWGRYSVVPGADLGIGVWVQFPGLRASAGSSRFSCATVPFRRRVTP